MTIKITNKISLYIRLLAVVLLTIYTAFKVSIYSFFAKNKQRYRNDASIWGNRILNIFSVELKIKGLENLKKDTTYILVSNHSSLFDIPILFSTFTGFNFVIVYKKELEKIPIFGLALKASPFIPIVREDPRKALQAIEKTLSQMEDNDCPIVFPEGTRSKDGNLGTFKRGAFMMASRSGKPIVPISIIGSADILPKGSLKVKTNALVKVVIKKPITYDKELDRVAEKELMATVYNQIKTNIEDNKHLIN